MNKILPTSRLSEITRHARVIRLAGFALFAGLAVLGSCASWPGLDNPILKIAPEYTALQLRGGTRMEAGPPNFGRRGKNSVAELGADDREDNVSVRASYGDGVSGFEFHYGRFESHSAANGIARNDWGNIPQGEMVDTRVSMNEFRLRYIAAMKLYENEDDEEWLQAGIGIQLGHKNMNFDVRGRSTSVSQKIAIKDDVSSMLAARVSGHRGPWGVTLDVAYNSGWALGTGDITGDFYDASVRVSYYIEAQDITVFGGYRRFDIPARGHEGIHEYDADFTLEGYVFGFEFDF